MKFTVTLNEDLATKEYHTYDGEQLYPSWKSNGENYYEHPLFDKHQIVSTFTVDSITVMGRKRIVTPIKCFLSKPYIKSVEGLPKRIVMDKRMDDF